MNKLKDYCLSITDGEHGSVPDVIDSEYYFLNNNNITDDGIVINPTDRKISKTDFDRIHRRTQLNTGDVVIASCGTIGKTQVIKDTDIKYEFSRSVGIIKCDTSKLLPEFLHFYFKNPETQKRIMRASEGAVQKHFYIGAMEDFGVNIPNLNEQQRMVLCLSAIDSKISNNTAICSDLESMAKLLYDYWFVQFDFPDENGRPYKSSGGKMVWNEELKREIPEGWEVKHLSDIAGLQQNAIFPTEGVEYNHYSIPAFDESKMPSLEDGGDIASNKYVVPNESILVSKLNPQFKRIWLVLDPSNNAICSTEFLPVKAMDVGIYYLYSLLNTDAFSVHLKQKASSSTGSRKRIDPENVMSFPFAYNKRVAQLFNEKTASLIQQTNQIPIENQQLASLRDFLLPMLMNGQVKVGKAGE